MSDPDNTDPPRSGPPAPPDAALLQRYVKEADQRAFAALVQRHSGWVYSIAKRRGGEADLAQECAQNVFLALALKAARLGSLPCLAAWLHRATVLESAALLRRNSRYQQAMKRHQEELAGRPAADAPDVWNSVRDKVDEALNCLSGADREMLILHHVEGRSFPEIARELGSSEAAAQRRGHRALEKLTARLRRCGIALPATALGAVLTKGMRTEAAQAAPVMSDILQSVRDAGAGGGAAAAAGGTISVPAWVGSPAMLAAIVVVTAGVPAWMGNGVGNGNFVVDSAGVAAPVGTLASVTAPAASLSAAEGSSVNKLAFLREALEALGKQRASEGPTKLGLQLRKYMLGLPAEDLEPVGKLLGGVPGYEGEFREILGAFSTRLAQLNPSLALKLLADRQDKGDGKNGGIRFSRTAFLDVLSRGAQLPAVLEICTGDSGLEQKLLGVWVGHDGPAAAEYAEQLLTVSKRDFDRAVYLGPWIMREPAQAVKWLDANAEARPGIYSRADSIFGTLGWWTAQQFPPQEAVELTLGLKDAVVRNNLVRGMWSAYAMRNPEVLAGLAPLLQSDENAKPLSVASVVKAWRKKDEAAAAAWVEQLPAGELKSAALRAMAKPVPSAQ